MTDVTIHPAASFIVAAANMETQLDDAKEKRDAAAPGSLAARFWARRCENLEASIRGANALIEAYEEREAGAPITTEES